MSLETLHYYHQQNVYYLYIAWPKQRTHAMPAIMVFPDWSGCNDFARQKAQQLAESGYVGVAVDVYGDGRLGHSVEEKTALMRPLTEDRNLLRQRVHAAYTAVKETGGIEAQRIGAIGFCFGGLCALDLARSGAPLKGVVSFHGLLHRPPGIPVLPMGSKILALHGYADPMVSPAQVNEFAEEMNQTQADWQIYMYGHALHAFTNPQANDAKFGTVYNVVVAHRSWQAMQNFFVEVFA